jgi:polysaccharide export outer membrane protein
LIASFGVIGLLNALTAAAVLRAQGQPKSTAPAARPAPTPPAAAEKPGPTPDTPAVTPPNAPAVPSLPATKPDASAAAPAPKSSASASAIPVGVPTPPDYVIGPDDMLSIVYWRDKDMTTDATERPDGKISLPLLNDVQAAGLTPSQLRDRLTEESRRYIEDPNVTVVVHQINSRKVFITGEVSKPGPYPVTEPTTVLQLFAISGCLRDYADSKKIVVVRNESGRAVTYPFNYKDVVARKNLRQNIELKPGDTIIVP